MLSKENKNRGRKIKDIDNGVRNNLCRDKIEKIITNERGITLTALITMVIILVILAGIGIAGITEHLGIIDLSSEVVDTFGSEQNRARLEAAVEDTVLSYDILGEDLTGEKLAEELKKEDWVKDVKVRTDEEGNVKDVVVETEDGEEFQVQYDEKTGKKEIEGVGESDGQSIPEVEAIYDRKSTSIIVKASDKSTGIKKIEIIFGGEILETENSDNATFVVSKSGTYKIKATANSGKVAYTTVQVSMKLMTPSIKVTSKGKAENGWYGADKIPVEVTISTEDETVTEVHYILRGVAEKEDTKVEGNKATVTINTAGRTIITGYTKDANRK